MWVCETCGLELDDSIETCPFGCGSKGSNSNAPEKTREVRIDEAKGVDIDDASSSTLLYISNEAGAEDDKACNFMPHASKQDIHQLDVFADGCTSNSVLLLTEGKTGRQLEIDSMACVLGREGDFSPELFSDQVSRTHLEISRKEGAWYGCHIGLNPSVLVTTSGRINMEHGIEYPLHNGDRLRMANQTFLIEVKEKEAECEDEADNTFGLDSSSELAEDAHAGDTLECWCVICPKCGAKHHVDNESNQVESCQKCTDLMDRREIKRVAPIFGTFKRSELIDVC